MANTTKTATKTDKTDKEIAKMVAKLTAKLAKEGRGELANDIITVAHAHLGVR
jgi:hypothetical protein